MKRIDMQCWQGRIGGKGSAWLFVVFMVLSFCMSCSSQKDEPSAGKDRTKKAIPVVLGKSSTFAVPVEIKAVGTVEPFATVAVKSQVTGVVDQIHFKEGDAVKKGSLLFSIDSRPFVALLDQAQSALLRDKAELANAQRELARYRGAASKGYVSTEAAEQAETKAATLTATIKADEAAVENARLQVDFCKILSPLDGQTGVVLTDRGNLVKANADTPMVTINQVMPVKVTFPVPGNRLTEIKKYQAEGSLQVMVQPMGSEIQKGRFSFIDNAVDPATGTIQLKAEFPNSEKMLWPGQYVDVKLVLTIRQNTVVVPSGAVQVGQKGPHLFVVGDDLVAHDRLVVPGTVAGDKTVIESGLEPGENIVVDGQMQLVDGAKVRTKESKKQDNPAPQEPSGDQGKKRSKP